MNAIETQGLSKQFGATDAVNDLSIRVASGTVFGLLGPNGAGKTTTIRMLSTVLKPTSGSAQVLGLDVSRASLAVRRRVSVIPQGGCLSPSLDVAGNVKYYLLMAGLGWRSACKRTEECIERFSLSPHRHKTPFQLSGGLRRMVQVARVLATEAALLFVDEPTVGLDPAYRRDVWRNLLESVEHKRTVLLSTQAMDEAEALCSSVCLLKKGRAVATGEMNALLGSLGETTVTIETDGTAEILENAVPLRRMPEVEELSYSAPFLTLRLQNSSAALPEVLRVLHSCDIAVHGLTVRPPTFEQVYLSVVGEGE